MVFLQDRRVRMRESDSKKNGYIVKVCRNRVGYHCAAGAKRMC